MKAEPGPPMTAQPLPKSGSLFGARIAGVRSSPTPRSKRSATRRADHSRQAASLSQAREPRNRAAPAAIDGLLEAEDEAPSMKPGRRSGVADRIADVLLLVGERLAMRASSAASLSKEFSALNL
jgi:hypothetical protein